MNREEFADVFSQNIRITGEKSHVYSMLIYSASDVESFVPVPSRQSILTVPVGNGFRISISKNEKRLSEHSSAIGARNVRATRKAFSRILKSGNELGFQLSDLTLNKGEKEIVTVRNDPVISQDTYSKYSADPLICPTYLGFSNGVSTAAFDIDMKIDCTEYTSDVGYLIFDVISLVMEDLAIYTGLQNAFLGKRSDDESPTMNPVELHCHFESLNHLMNYLTSIFSDDVDIRISEGRSVEFLSRGGTWGEIVLMESGVKIYFRSVVDFDLGIRLIDALELEVKN